MACRFEAWLKPAEREALGVVREGFALVRAIERRFSLFHPESELVRINHGAHLGPVSVSEDLFDLLLLAKRITRLSDGVHDVTSGALSRCWGLLERCARIPAPEALAAARRLTGWARVRLDENARTIAFAEPGVEINLGSLGKGYALDRMAARLTRAGVSDFLVGAGSSTVVACGHGLDGAGWPVLVRRDKKRGRTERLMNEALSTSGPHEQTFETAGRRFCHILDPRSGRPSTRVGAVSVIARTGVIAEAVSTALFLLEEAPARRLIDTTGARRCA